MSKCGFQSVVHSSEASHTGPVIPALRTSLAAAVAAGVLAAGSCSSSAGCPPGAPCPASAPRVIFGAAINGKSTAPPKAGTLPSYRVRPGEYLVVRVAVTVPRHVRVTDLSFGISKGTWGGGPNGTGGMNPILAHYRQPLSAGSHTFGLRWRNPGTPPWRQPVPSHRLVQSPAIRDRCAGHRPVDTELTPPAAAAAAWKAAPGPLRASLLQRSGPSESLEDRGFQLGSRTPLG
jgi:hypothetical protein